MRVDFYHAEEPEKIVATASWDGREAVLDRADDPATGAAVTRIFRAVPVVSDDPALRSSAGRGATVVEPGTLEWFRAAAQVRAPKVGLSARFIATVRVGSGYDPASNYRPFETQVERITQRD